MILVQLLLILFFFMINYWIYFPTCVRVVQETLLFQKNKHGFNVTAKILSVFKIEKIGTDNSYYRI
jgi:hypothetical protein